jgi:hypothetical protein
MKRLVCFFAILLLAGTGVFARQAYMLWYHPEALPLTVSVPLIRAAREIYPFSVVPGGVLNGQELAESMAKDPVAREHYEGIRPERLWRQEVQEPMLVYVSYRKANQIFWTDHKVKIASGESVLTDGVNLVRGRCGNRIAFRRPTPLASATTPPEVPPTDIVFETPLPKLLPPTIIEPLPPEVSIAEKVIDRRHWPPPIWCCSAQNRRQPSPVPEPGTLALVGTGLFAAAALFRRKR